jgi:hypothetical protein
MGGGTPVFNLGDGGLTFNTPLTLLNDIWSKFSNLQATTLSAAPGFKPTPLQYYQPWATPRRVLNQNISLLRLLQHGNGQCTSFAGLFYNAILAQGLATPVANSEVDMARGSIGTVELEKITVKYNPDAFGNLQPINQEGFLVGPWKFGPANNAGAFYPYLNTASPGTGSPLMLPNRNAREGMPTGGPEFHYTFVMNTTAYTAQLRSPVVYQGSMGTGAPLLGQNNPDPYASFDNHVVVKITSPGGSVRYYDPSYGIVFPSLGLLQDREVAGFFSQQQYANSGFTQVYIRKPGRALELQETPIKLPTPGKK